MALWLKNIWGNGWSMPSHVVVYYTRSQALKFSYICGGSAFVVVPAIIQ
jgi:hypothetical protein